MAQLELGLIASEIVGHDSVAQLFRAGLESECKTLIRLDGADRFVLADSDYLQVCVCRQAFEEREGGRRIEQGDLVEVQ